MAVFYATTGADYTTTASTNLTASVWQTWATANTATVWQSWQVTGSDIWQAWAVNGGYQATGGTLVGPAVQVDPEVLARQQQAQREAREAAAERAAARDRRARELLLAHLTKTQRREFERNGHFHIETAGGKRRYRLRPGYPPIRVKGEDGRRWSYCIHPRGHAFPPDDIALAHKLMLETAEDEFLAVANASAA